MFTYNVKVLLIVKKQIIRYKVLCVTTVLVYHRSNRRTRGSYRICTAIFTDESCYKRLVLQPYSEHSNFLALKSPRVQRRSGDMKQSVYNQPVCIDSPLRPPSHPHLQNNMLLQYTQPFTLWSVYKTIVGALLTETVLKQVMLIPECFICSNFKLCQNLFFIG